ncbi:MAG TPA: PAS domain-containing protein [Burkholderiales bacterium]
MTHGHGGAVGDLVMVLCARPAKSCARSGVMLARVRSIGVFELLSAAAWARALGYSPAELNGKSLRGLMRLEKPAALDVVAALLDESDLQPLEVTLRCKNGGCKRFRLHRQLDTYGEAVFVVADELVEDRVAPRGVYA